MWLPDASSGFPDGVTMAMHKNVTSSGSPAHGVDLLAAPTLLFSDQQRLRDEGVQSPTLGRMMMRVVLPFGLVPPAMLLFAMHDHASAYGVEDLVVSWDLIALLMFAAELATVWLLAQLLRHMAPLGRTPTRELAWLAAALSAAPLWASSVVLMLPSLGALAVSHLLGHVASAVALYRTVRTVLRVDCEVEALHLALMVYGAVLALWVLLIGLLALSLATF